MVKTEYLSPIKIGAVAALSVVTALPLYSQQIKVQAPKEYEAGRPFNVVYRLSSVSDADVKSDPNFSGLDLLYGPAVGTSSSFSNINGRVSSSSHVEVTYTLMATREGKYSISGFKMSVEGKEVAAPATTIVIRGQSTSGLGASSMGREQMRQPARSRAGEYSYQAIVPRRSVYVQEALPVVYRLQSSETPEINGTAPSSYDGFVSHDLLGNAPRQLQLERIGGRDWVVVDVIKELLFPQRAGELQIPSNEISVLQRLQDPDGDPFFTRTEERKLNTQPVSITVKPLPTEGQPEDFSGAVGSFSARYKLGSTQWKTNEAVSLQLVLEGQGNLKIAKIPSIKLPSDIEVYDPVEKTSQSYEGGSLRSTRTIEYNLIPRSVGKITIPAVALSFFNPATARYERTTTKSLEINIAQGKAIDETNTLLSSSNQGDKNTPYGLVDALISQAPRDTNLWLLLLGHLALGLVALLSYVFYRKRQLVLSDTVGLAASRANAVANKRLKLAHRYLSEGKREPFLEELLQALWGYLGDKLSLPLSVLSRDVVAEHLRERGMASEETIAQLTQTIDRIEFTRFAPQSVGSDLKELYDEAVQSITAIETSQKP